MLLAAASTLNRPASIDCCKLATATVPVHSLVQVKANKSKQMLPSKLNQLQLNCCVSAPTTIQMSMQNTCFGYLMTINCTAIFYLNTFEIYSLKLTAV